MARLALAAFAALLFVSTGRAAPAPNEPIPREPAALARTLAATTEDLRTAIDLWRPKSSSAPQDVVLLSLYQQRIYRVLGRNPQLSRATVELLSRDLARV